MIAEFAGKHPQIVVDIDSSLASTLMVGDTVSVSVESHTLTGKISALSNISNANLLSTVRITLENAEKYIGKSATMTFFSVASTKSDTLLLPINAVKIISEDEGEISIVSGSGVLEKQTVKL
jgi:hypothetical protein